MRPRRHRRQLARRLLELVALQAIVDVDLGEALQADAALVAERDFLDVVLEALERRDVAFPDEVLAAEQAHLGAALDDAVADHAASDRAELGHAERLAHFGVAEDDLFDDRREHAFQERRHVVDRVVDHRVLLDLHGQIVGQALALGLRLDVEGDDDGLGGRRQVDVALRHAADRRVQHADLDLFVLDLGQRALERLRRTVHVRLDDEVEILGLSRRHRLEQLVERALGGLEQLLLALLLRAVLDDRLGLLLVLHDVELVTGGADRLEADDFDGRCRPGLVQRAAEIVQHRANTAVLRTRDHVLAALQGALLHQERRHRTAALLQARLDDQTARIAVRARLEIHDLRLQRQHFQQLVDALAGLGRHFAEGRVAAPVFGLHAVIRELAAHLVQVRTRLVDLVDCHDDRHVGRLGVVDRFDRLRHHAVIRRNDQHDDVRRLGAAGAHRREGLVARRIEEHDAAFARHIRDIRADVLGDAAGFARRRMRLADRIQQACLAVVDVAHDRDDRGALHFPG